MVYVVVEQKRRRRSEYYEGKKNMSKIVEECVHGSQYEVFEEEEDEVVCRVCGVVKGEEYNDNSGSKNIEPKIAPLIEAVGVVWKQQQQQKQQQERGIMVKPQRHSGFGLSSSGGGGSSKSRTSLYQDAEVGSKPDMKIFANRYMRYTNTDLVIVSNISQKLNITNVVAHDVWKWYRKLRGEPGLRLTKAKILVVVFWGVCKCYGQPVSELRLLEAIQTNLRVRRAHSYLKSIMEASSYLDTGSREIILQRMGFFEMMNGRIDEDDGGGVGGKHRIKNSSGNMGENNNKGRVNPSKKQRETTKRTKFFLQNEILILREKYSEKLAGEISSVAKSLLPSLMFNFEVCDKRNPARAARAAIRMAERRCGAGAVDDGMQIMMKVREKQKKRGKVGK